MEEDFWMYTEQPENGPPSAIPFVVQQQLAFGGVAIGTMICMTWLIREVRLLVESCKL